MKIAIYPIRSPLHNEVMIEENSRRLLDDLKAFTGFEYEIVDLDHLYDADLSLILIQSGGSEGEFKKIYNQLRAPYYLLTYGGNNSLAASLEILTFINQQGKDGEVLHGNGSYIAKRILELLSVEKEREYDRLGVIGIPSDWLIGSHVDYPKAKTVFGVELVDLTTSELIENYQNIDQRSIELPKLASYDEKELLEAYRVYLALKKMVVDHNLKGLTIRCFDLLDTIKTTACLGLALLNREGIIASCEGDIPAMLSAYSILKVTKEHAFQANPAFIDRDKNTILFAHCTLPLDMVDSYTFDTHFESSIGVGIHGEMKVGDITILKVGPHLDSFYCEEGTLVENQYKKDKCRTQIMLHMNADLSYFLSHPLGNHHLICYGKKKEALVEYLTSIGLKEVF